MPQSLPYSVMCSQCRKTHGDTADNPFAFIEATKALGWVIPMALENKPIKCPDCVSKS